MSRLAHGQSVKYIDTENGENGAPADSFQASGTAAYFVALASAGHAKTTFMDEGESHGIPDRSHNVVIAPGPFTPVYKQQCPTELVEQTRVRATPFSGVHRRIAAFDDFIAYQP